MTTRDEFAELLFDLEDAAKSPLDSDPPIRSAGRCDQVEVEQELFSVYDTQAARIAALERELAILKRMGDHQMPESARIFEADITNKALYRMITAEDALINAKAHIAELEAALSGLEEHVEHIRRWCNQNNSAFDGSQVSQAIIRMCDDALDAARKAQAEPDAQHYVNEDEIPF